MSTANEIAAAFDTVDALLEQATDAAPAVALLLSRAQEQGVSEHQLAANLRTNVSASQSMSIPISGMAGIIRPNPTK